MRKSWVLLLGILPGLVLGAGPEIELERADVDVTNTASLQRGASLFVNNCMGCHGVQFHRYNRLASDLGLSEELVERHLMVTGDQIGDTMETAMPSDDAEEWFGVAPPDLSVIARARGADWIYTFLKSFYRDETQQFGVNNKVMPATAMPHVLRHLQGVQEAQYESDNGTARFVGFELAEEGQLSPGEFDRVATDLTRFLVYVGEPEQLERQRVGIWVLLFLVVLTGLFYALKKEYWRDIH